MTLPAGVLSGDASTCAAAIRDSRRVLVVGHVDPDGDAIGSVLGMGWFLQELGIPHVLACDSPIPARWSFLPRDEPIVTECADDHDLIVTVDCNDRQRMGRFHSQALREGMAVVNIDHHLTNTLFGTVNWVEPETSATAEMLLDLADPLGVTLTREAATCLLTGIVTDTQAFRTPNTSPLTMEKALRAINAGAPLADIISRTVDYRSFTAMCLWARVIREAQLKDGVLWAEVTQADTRACQAGREARNGLINFLLTAKETRAVILLIEISEELTDVSVRSKPDIDVSAGAVRLGGGGHRQAAGCKLRLPLAEARTVVAAAFEESLAEQGVTWSVSGAAQ